MTFLHFLNCALLTYAPTVVVDRSTVVYVPRGNRRLVGRASRCTATRFLVPQCR